MNILFFTHERSYGGASRALVTLIKDLKNEHNIYVVVPFKNAKIVEELNKLNVNVISCFYSWWQIPCHVSVVNKLLYRVAYCLNFLAIYKLVGKIKKLNIDIIHSNTSVIDIGAIVANKLKIPHVWHFREFTGSHLKFIKGKKKSFEFINAYGNKVIYISQAIKNFYENNINKKLGVLIYDGVSDDFIIEKDYSKRKLITFLLVATLEKNKGQELALKAVKELKDRGILNFKLILAGGDPTGYWGYLKNLIIEFEIEEFVQYVGFVDDMKDLRTNVDVELMCAPSEAFGLVTVEGMLAGNPIIGSNSGATSELIKDNENGYLYDFNNASDLALKMELFIKDNFKIKKYGINAKNYAIKNFSSKKNSVSTIKLYNSLLKGKNK